MQFWRDLRPNEGRTAAKRPISLELPGQRKQESQKLSATTLAALRGRHSTYNLLSKSLKCAQGSQDVCCF